MRIRACHITMAGVRDSCPRTPLANVSGNPAIPSGLDKFVQLKNPLRTIFRALTRSAGVDSQQLALITAFVGLAIVLFGAAMSSPISYDEEQYVAGAYFARDLSLYRDFISFQPPPYTWIVAAIFQVFDGWYLLVARVVTWALAFASCVLLFSLLRSTWDRQRRRVRARSRLREFTVHARTVGGNSQ